jgi:hypothetical protein
MSDSSPTEPQPARSWARPRPGRRPPGALLAARLAARTAPRGAREILNAPLTGSIDEIRRFKRSLLVTFKANGTAVPTPVWAAEADGRLYVRSERTAGKIKRLGKDTRVLIAPCTVRGRPLGAPLQARGAVLGAERESVGERALAGRYGLGRWLFEWAIDLMRVDMCYLEITPSRWE